MNDRRALLTATLGFLRLEPGPREPALDALHAYMDSARGVRAIEAGMRAQHHELTLERASGGWTAVFYFTGKSNLPAAAPAGLATLPTPWHAVQWAAWQVLTRERD